MNGMIAATVVVGVIALAAVACDGTAAEHQLQRVSGGTLTWLATGTMASPFESDNRGLTIIKHMFYYAS